MIFKAVLLEALGLLVREESRSSELICCCCGFWTELAWATQVVCFFCCLHSIEWLWSICNKDHEHTPSFLFRLGRSSFIRIQYCVITLFRESWMPHAWAVCVVGSLLRLWTQLLVFCIAMFFCVWPACSLCAYYCEKLAMLRVVNAGHDRQCPDAYSGHNKARRHWGPGGSCITGQAECVDVNLTNMKLKIN